MPQSPDEQEQCRRTAPTTMGTDDQSMINRSADIDLSARGDY
jgi:hypothetical protein